jgi:hypothetical protein
MPHFAVYSLSTLERGLRGTTPLQTFIFALRQEFFGLMKEALYMEAAKNGGKKDGRTAVVSLISLLLVLSLFGPDWYETGLLYNRTENLFPVADI